MITDDKAMHMLGVARRMREYALEDGADEKRAEEAFVVGWLHDIGYEFTSKANHENYGADILERMNFPYADEIRHHAEPGDGEMLGWLIKADMTVDHQGKFCTLEERLNGIKERYGEGETYRKCVKIAECVNSR